MSPLTARKFSVEINNVFCKGCEICIRLCPKDAIALNGKGKAELADTERCNGCLNCEVYCPDFAVSVREVAYSA